MSKTLCTFCRKPLREPRLVVHSADPKVPTFCLPKVNYRQLTRAASETS